MDEINLDCGVYQIRNIITGFCYDGQSIYLKKRHIQHWSLLKNNKHKNSHLQNSYNKHGKEFFVFEILIYCKPEDLTLYEQLFCDIDKSHGLSYNTRDCVDSNRGIKRTEESKEKMRIAKSNPSDEVRRKISENHADMSGKNNPMYGLKGENHPAHGRIHTKEELEKMSKALKGRTFTEEHKRNIINNRPYKYGKNNPTITKKEVVLKVLNMLDGTMFRKDIAKQLNISCQIVSKIKNGYYNDMYNIPTKKLEYKNRRGKNSPRYGIAHTPEAIEKMSGKNSPMYGKKGKDNFRTTKKDMVLRISKLLSEGMSQDKISKELNISCPVISKVKNGKYNDIYDLPKIKYPTAIIKGKNKPNIIKKEIVIKIKNMLKDNVPVKNIVKILGVSKSSVYRTKNKFYDNIYNL